MWKCFAQTDIAFFNIYTVIQKINESEKSQKFRFCCVYMNSCSCWHDGTKEACIIQNINMCMKDKYKHKQKAKQKRRNGSGISMGDMEMVSTVGTTARPKRINVNTTRATNDTTGAALRGLAPTLGRSPRADTHLAGSQTPPRALTHSRAPCSLCMLSPATISSIQTQEFLKKLINFKHFVSITIKDCNPWQEY